jgi:hypothetical protein
MTTPAPPQSTRERIATLLNDLPSESLLLVEQFVRSLKEKPARREQSRYPIVFVPAGKVALWETILSEGYDGDALADTESLYDDV